MPGGLQHGSPETLHDRLPAAGVFCKGTSGSGTCLLSPGVFALWHEYLHCPWPGVVVWAETQWLAAQWQAARGSQALGHVWVPETPVVLGEEARSTTMHEQHVYWNHFWSGHDEFWFGLACRDALLWHAC